MEIRRLTEDDRDALVAVRLPAFGTTTLGGDRVEHPAFERWGLFLDEQLVATATRKPYASWFRGREVPTCGVGGVAIAPEFRGRGLLRPLMERLHDDARAQGDVIATLFASAPGIYASLGYRTVGAMDTIEVPATALRGFTRQRELRRATADDLPEVKRIYADWASRHDGPLTRTSVEFDHDVWLNDATGVTLALDEDGRAVAYAAWNRSPGVGGDAFVEVEDLVWVDDASRDTLLWMFGTFSSMTPTVRFDTSGTELTSVLPDHRVREHHPYDLLVLRPGEFEPPTGTVLVRDYF
ncbi:GNAT family N-acetyltransferase [Aeromicrobium senzhongii]|uniref:GNAT family N-acetyltransferase n=1 Tax=Aeromicrobium senzhongii TaxID=2663859 RepID=A0ABX6SQW4_9ACTN|nr:GNAT family N-acetyltransferase [Aeromicrobium senzhongii]MTB89241.1 GNAT family N-acetyltransferase [Aeromicrobium senzhongii]QNL93497.1 GNAT family N-acetyltransferase [Aeromicrobium senzhongii]